MVQASKLREKQELQKIRDVPGYYKWWACKEELELILSALQAPFDDIKDGIETADGLFCIYVGIAEKESVRKRLDWHVNDPHTETRVRNGILSTLRQSIASIVARNQYDKTAANAFIDKLYIEWFYNENPIKSDRAHIELHEIERRLMTDYFRILNIRDNRHPCDAYTAIKLSALRKARKHIQN